jgi:TRAP-type C4-dicarboxylate transport system substrate-binding protein
VKVTFYHAQTLGKLFDQPKMLKGGICDVTQLPDVSPDFPLLHIFEAPFVISSQARAQEAFGAMYYKGLLKEHLKDYKFLWWQAIAPIHLVLRNKKVTRMEELKGLKIRGMPGLRTVFNEALGATGVAMPTAESFMALERGTLDGVNTAVESAVSLKFNEVTKYWIWEPICTGGLMIAMNLKVWNSMPPDIQTIIEQLSIEAHYRFKELMQTPSESRALLKKLGWEVYELSPEERARWHKVAEPIVDKWLAEREAKGLPMRKVMEAVKRVSESFD